MSPGKKVLRLSADWVELTVYRAALEAIAQHKEPWQRGESGEPEPQELARAVLDQFPRDGS